MDNFQFSCRSEGKATLALALGIVMAHAPGKKATHFLVRDVKDDPQATAETRRRARSGVQELVLLWHEDSALPAAQPLPYPLDAKNAPEFVDNWLAAQPQRAGKYEDGDVDNYPAWQIDVGPWGHGGGSRYGVCAITPCWAWSGK